MEDTLAKFGVKGAHLLTGLIAGVMGLIFNNKPRTLKEKIKAYIIVLAGAVLTGYITPLVLIKWDALLSVEHSVAFLVGLFGIGIAQGIFMVVSKFKDNPIGTAKEVFAEFSQYFSRFFKK